MSLLCEYLETQPKCPRPTRHVSNLMAELLGQNKMGQKEEVCIKISFCLLSHLPLSLCEHHVFCKLCWADFSLGGNDLANSLVAT